MSNEYGLAAGQYCIGRHAIIAVVFNAILDAIIFAFTTYLFVTITDAGAVT